MRWLGHKQHFIAAYNCNFGLATEVGRFVVSTVGEYYVNKELTPLGPNKDDLYETMVFETTGETMPCGCPVVANYIELKAKRYTNPKAAEIGHMEIVDEVGMWEIEKQIDENLPEF